MKAKALRAFVVAWVILGIAEQKPEPALGPLGPPTITLDVDSASAQVKHLYDREKLAVCPVDDDWAF